MSAHPTLSTDLTASHLGEAARHFALEFVAQCTSTNDTLAERGADEGRLQVLLAHCQTAGRGRRGRSWLSIPGRGLTFSCGWNLPQTAPSPAGLSLVVGLALAEALESLGAHNIRLKWPNDLLAGGAKLAGILIELVSGQQRTRRVIIGIGINLRGDGELPPGATALCDHAAQLPADEAILARILRRLRARLLDFAAGGFAAVRDDWQQRDAFRGQAVCITGDAMNEQGLCEGVDTDGALLLRTPGGMQRILSGDVSLRAGA
ncbi:MAG: biotin--[acetyl-CoA-carboxylase] ligase [Pseudazoarcus pumilus]|nr:biotin--[acetyl-CoA-carboxylase] ligase [Pseudazoarcus pumilus]